MYVLIISCLWSHALNLKLCPDLSVRSYLRALQLHVMEHGVMELLLSDSGSSFVAGGNLIRDFIKDSETQKFLTDNGIQNITIDQYPKGHNELGGLIESGVKMAKRLIYGAIKSNVLEFSDFHFLICQTVQLLNRRPLIFKEALRDFSTSELPSPITPEMLLKGRELVGMNLIPEFSDPNGDEYFPIADPKHVNESMVKLAKCREILVKLFNENYTSNLLDMAGSVPNRYVPTAHKPLKVGDIILLREPLLKPVNYPMAIIRDVTINSLGEVTEVSAFKGSTRELVRRHTASVIPLLACTPSDEALTQNSCDEAQDSNMDPENSATADSRLGRPRRKTAAAFLKRLPTMDI